MFQYHTLITITVCRKLYFQGFPLSAACSTGEWFQNIHTGFTIFIYFFTCGLLLLFSLVGVIRSGAVGPILFRQRRLDKT